MLHEWSKEKGTRNNWAIPENIHSYTTDSFSDFQRGGGVYDYGILKAWGGIYVWKSEGMGGGSLGGISGEESAQ